MKRKKKWQILGFVFILLVFTTSMISCRTERENEKNNDSDTATSYENIATIPLKSEWGETPDEMTVVYKEGSRTWPAEFVGFGADGDRFRSVTGGQIGPWTDQPVNFKGFSSGGVKLVYRYKLSFKKKVEINSIEIEGAGWGEVRLLDRRMNEVVKYDLPGGNEFHRYTIHTYGSTGTVFYLEENEDGTNEFRYRSEIRVNASPECAAKADIVLNGNDFSSLSDMAEGANQKWFEENDSLFTYWDLDKDANPIWVEYEAFLSKGDWNIGLCAINQSVFGHPGLDPNAYGSFRILNNLTNEWFEVPASDTRLNTGSFLYKVPKEGIYTVRFTWQNDEVVVDKTDGTTLLSDANLKIVRVFFDALDNEDEDNDKNKKEREEADWWDTFRKWFEYEKDR